MAKFQPAPRGKHITRATVVGFTHSGEAFVLRTLTGKESPVKRAKALLDKQGYIFGSVLVILAGWPEFYHVSKEELSHINWDDCLYIPDDDNRRR